MWLVIIGAESVHGVLQTLFLAPIVGDFHARQISVFTGSLLILTIAWLFIRWIQVRTTRSLLAVEYKSMISLTAKAGTHHQVSKKECCRLLKTATLLRPADETQIGPTS